MIDVLELSKKTNCSMMLFWTIGLKHIYALRYGFIKTYLFDENRPHQNALYLLFKPRDLFEFNEFVEQQKAQNINFLDEYDCNGYSVIVYRLPVIYSDDYEKFFQGKYSKMSEKFKALIPESIKSYSSPKDDVNLFYLIVRKSPILKDLWERLICDPKCPDEKIDEVWPIYNFQREKLELYELCTDSNF